MNKENSAIPENQYLEKQAKHTMNHFNRLGGKINDVGALYIRFENLIEKPKECLTKVFKHIGLDVDGEEIDNILEKYQSAKDIAKNKNTSQKPILSQEQKDILLKYLSETCEKLGYEIPDYAK